jgi:hypothetical protein
MVSSKNGVHTFFILIKILIFFSFLLTVGLLWFVKFLLDSKG